jgi:hypothetical protein
MLWWQQKVITKTSSVISPYFQIRTVPLCDLFRYFIIQRKQSVLTWRHVTLLHLYYAKYNKKCIDGPRSPMRQTRTFNFARTHGFTISRLSTRDGPIIVRSVTEEICNRYHVQDGDILQSVNGERFPDDCTTLMAIDILSNHVNSGEAILYGFQSRIDYNREQVNPRFLRNMTSDSNMYPTHEALAINGFYASRRREHSATVQVQLITDALSAELGIVIGDILFSIDGIEATSLSNALLYTRQTEGLQSFRLISKVAYQRANTYDSLRMSWDFQNPCRHCGYVYLTCEDCNVRQQCCSSGKYMRNDSVPKLLPLPPALEHLALHRIEHMGPKSSYYNNILSMGVTGIDNGKGGGWESIRGAHAIKLNGRTYHYLPKTGGTGGLQYFTWDASDAMYAHSADINRRTEHVMQSNLQHIYRELQQCNYIVQELHQIGVLADSEEITDHNCQDVILKMNVQTSAFDVVAITADSTTGERIIQRY